MTKIVFFDVDGTIVTDRAQGGDWIVPESAARAIRTARERGNLCFINSGRPYCNIDKDIINIGFDGVISGCGTDIRIGEEKIFSAGNDKKVCRIMLDACRKYRVNGFFERRDVNWFEGSRNGWIDDFISEIAKNGAVTRTDTESPDFSFDKMCAFFYEESDKEGFVKIAKEHFDIIMRSESFLEIVPKGCSKGKAMEIVLRYYDLPKECSYAIGDSANDIDMFLATPNSIGMGNGEGIEKYVSFMTRDILDDGVEYALRHFDII